MQKLSQVGLIGLLFILVSACGGGGDSSNDDTNIPLHGVCGQAAQEFEFDAIGFSDLEFCAVGNASPVSPIFPDEGQTVTWVCKGLNSGTDAACDASRKTETVTTPETFTFQTENYIELGLISNATVTVTTLDQSHEFLQTNTDEHGLYTVDSVQLKQDIQNILGEIPEYLLVSATGGIDTDPDDDGIIVESEKVPLQGTVSSIINTQKFLDEDNLSVNLISTAIANLVNTNNISQQKLTALTKSLGMTDINNDGKVDNSDVHEYSMLIHESKAEELLRKEYLATLHENNLDDGKQALDNIKKDQFLIEVESEIIANTAYISLSTEYEDLLVYYGKNIKKGDVLSNLFSTPISLEKNQYIAYKACDGNRACGNLDVISFDGKKVELYIAKELESSIYEDTTYANSLRGEINSNYADYLRVNEELYLEEKKVIDINSELEEIKEKIKSIEAIKML